MNKTKTLISALLLAVFGWLASGCTSMTTKDTSVPWGKPATWENRMPGMGY